MNTTSIKTMTADIAQTIIAHSKATPCLLCGRRPHIGAVFIPEDQKRVGAPAGKIRTIAYTLCKRCYRKPDHPARVEKRIFDDLAAMNRVN